MTKNTFSTFPKSFRGVMSKKPQNIEILTKIFLRHTPIDPLELSNRPKNSFADGQHIFIDRLKFKKFCGVRAKASMIHRVR